MSFLNFENVSLENTKPTAQATPRTLWHKEDYRFRGLNWTQVGCPQIDEWYTTVTQYSLPPDSLNHTYWYYVSGISLTVLCSIAILTNIICIVVFTRPVMKSTISIILLILSCSDLIQAIIALLMRGIQRILEGNCAWLPYIRGIQPILVPYFVPILGTVQFVSAYLTILLTLERFVAICKPTNVGTYFTDRKTIYYCAGVVISSILYNLPKWFEWDAKAKFLENRFLGIIVLPTNLTKNSTYEFGYTDVGSFILLHVVPFVLLLIFGLIIFVRMCRMANTRKRMSHQQRYEMSVARMVLAVSCLHLLCNFVTFVASIFKFAHGFVPNDILFVVNDIAQFILLLPPPLNFVIYCIGSRTFWNVLLQFIGTKQETDNWQRRRSDSTALQNLVVQIRVRSRWLRRTRRAREGRTIEENLT